MARRESSRNPPGVAPEYVSAEEATRLLRVKPQTLYTYVSRGLIRSVGQLDDKRRLYHREDVIGARNAGIPIAWLSRGKGPLPEGIPAPDFMLEDLTGLPALLDL